MTRTKGGSLRSVTLGEVVQRTGGMFKTGPFGSQLHARDYTATGTPLVMPVNLGDNEIREAGIARVGERDVRRLRRHLLRKGDIVLSRRGDVGRRSMVRAEQTGWLCGTGCLVARFGKRQDDVNPEYVAEYLGSVAATSWLADNAVGGTMLNLNTSILAALPIVLPPRAEQDAIVTLLKQARGQVSTLEGIIAKAETVKQGLMQQLLTGKTRLPGFSRSWSRRRIGDFAQVRAGGTPSTTVRRYWGGDVPWMNSGEVHQKQVSTVRGRITVEGLRESSAHLFPPGTVLMALAGQGKTRGTVAVSRIPLATNQSIAGIYPSPEHDADYLYFNLESRYAELRGESAGAGGRGGLNLKIINSIEVPYPAIPEQRAIARILMDSHLGITCLLSKLEKVRDIKQGMMQELLTGRARLPVEDMTE